MVSSQTLLSEFHNLPATELERNGENIRGEDKPELGMKVIETKRREEKTRIKEGIL